MDVECNFINDSAELRREELGRVSIKVPAAFNAHDVHEYYAELWHRVIEPKARRVLIARGFRYGRADEAGLVEIIYRALEGKALLHHQSTRVIKPNGHDDLLNDWGIHHLHLGVGPDAENPMFVPRTSNLLFARVTDDALYAIAVLPHKFPSGMPTFHCKELVQTLHENWPDSLHLARREGVLPGKNWSDQEISELRKAHITTLLWVDDGTCYAMMGGGFSTAGNSLRAGVVADIFLEELVAVERIAREEAGHLAEQIAAAGLPRPEKLRLKLLEQTDEAYFVADVSAPDVRLRVARRRDAEWSSPSAPPLSQRITWPEGSTGAS